MKVDNADDNYYDNFDNYGDDSDNDVDDMTMVVLMEVIMMNVIAIILMNYFKNNFADSQFIHYW